MDAPRLRVPHPGPRTRGHLERIRGAEASAGLTFGLSPETVVMERARGAAIEDVDGNVFLDFTAGFGSLNAGHCHPKVVEAVQAQAAKGHQAMSMGSDVRLRLVEKVLSLIPGAEKRMILGASGSEAAEAAIKIARRVTGRQDVVAFEGAFHGRTQGALALMGRKGQRAGLPALQTGIHHVPFPYAYRSPFGRDEAACMEGTLRYIEEFLKNPASGWGEVAAVIIEPVQGNGGMIPAPHGFLRGLREICDRHGVLLIIDEVMSGFCRTGRMFAYLHEEGVDPDILVMGKSLSGGLPLSACAVKKEIADAAGAGTESSTYAGNLVACASGLASIEVYEDEGLAERAAEMGGYFMRRLGELAERHAVVGEVRGRGLMVAAELVSDRSTREPLMVAKEASAAAVERGFLLYPGGHYANVLAFLPPLIINEGHVDKAVEILDEVLLAVPRMK